MLKRSHTRIMLLALGTVAALWLGATVGAQRRATEKRAAVASGAPDYRNPRVPVERRVADLLARMTPEEKVAQTEALWPAQQKQLVMDEQGNFSPTRARDVLKYGLGQISGPSLGNDSELVGQDGPYRKKGAREMALFTNAIQKYVIENTRLGIPVIFHEEGLHGLMAPGATSYPQAIALASTWNPELVQQVYSTVAAEARARGAHQLLSPVLDLAREPRWGRTEETFGEDPYLVSRMGVAAVKGFQGRGPNIDEQHVIATLKHFAGHGQPEGGTNIGPANYSERVLREDFFAPFEAAVTEGKVMSLMASYNEIDGIPSHANKWLLDQVLRQEWGFDGFIVSDYFAIRELMERHHVVADKTDAAKRALEAGVDVELPFIECNNTLVEQVKAGRVSMATLDKTVARILRAKFLLGLFERPYADPDNAARVNDSAAHRQLAVQAAHEAIILLKNEHNLLPLNQQQLKSIAVIGPNAAGIHLGEYSGDPTRAVSILQGIKDKVGAGVRVNYAEGCKITEGAPAKHGAPSWWNDDVRLSDPAQDAVRIAEAVRAARDSDVAVLVLGGNVETAREAWAETHLGDRDSLELLGQQNELVKAVVATGKPTIVFFLNGQPITFNYIAEHVPAIFEGWYLGEEAGTAVADVLFGDYNPAGRLPVTIPRSVGQLPVYYNQKPTAKRGYLFTGKEPLYVFGHGLSYTTFKYANLRVTPARTGTAGQATVSVDVTNTGARAGDEVVQMYLRDEVSSVTRPTKELKDFRRLSFAPGQTRTVQFVVTPNKLSFLDENMKRIVEPGTFNIMVGGSSSPERQLAIKLEVVNQ